jgi:secreted PhoX family phosphatase
MCNHSPNPTFSSILESRLQRRQVLQGGIAAAVAFKLENTGAEQGMQVGSHHDGMHFFPIEGKDPWQGSSTEGLLVFNHEYVEPRFMHAAAVGQKLDSDLYPTNPDGTRDPDQVLKELNGHGVSIVHIKQQGDGSWEVVRDRLNRRITGLTLMEIHGPVRGSDFVKTKFSPEGTMTRGTLNNCAHGVTPWNTYLTCEENWAGYFSNTSKGPDQKPNLPREHKRYGVSTETSRYGWELASNKADEFIRFNATPTAADATQDYRNEPNTFGWVVEIDPFDPSSTPKKRTALGRFAHEGVVFQPPVEGQPIVALHGGRCPLRVHLQVRLCRALPQGDGGWPPVGQWHPVRGQVQRRRHRGVAAAGVWAKRPHARRTASPARRTCW